MSDTPQKNPAAVALGRLGGAAGRGASKARTSEQARKAVNARWHWHKLAIDYHNNGYYPNDGTGNEPKFWQAVEKESAKRTANRQNTINSL